MPATPLRPARRCRRSSTRRTSTTSVASSKNPSTFGASVTFTATVAGSNPTGSVNFKDGGGSITGCSAVALTGSGNSRTATCTTSALSVGDAQHHRCLRRRRRQCRRRPARRCRRSSARRDRRRRRRRWPARRIRRRSAPASPSPRRSPAAIRPAASTSRMARSSISGCSAVALTGSGNSRTAACSTSALTRGHAQHHRGLRR